VEPSRLAPLRSRGSHFGTCRTHTDVIDRPLSGSRGVGWLGPAPPRRLTAPSHRAAGTHPSEPARAPLDAGAVESVTNWTQVRRFHECLIGMGLRMVRSARFVSTQRAHTSSWTENFGKHEQTVLGLRSASEASFASPTNQPLVEALPAVQLPSFVKRARVTNHATSRSRTFRHTERFVIESSRSSITMWGTQLSTRPNS
jgi:hypothetical protein